MTATIGLDIGGTNVRGVRLDASGTVLAEARAGSPPAGTEVLVGTCVDVIAQVSGAGEAIGVGIAGLIDADGVVRYSPNLPHLRNAPLREALAAATGRAVAVDNDANVAMLAEAAHGAARGTSDALLVTLGTGIGGGMLVDGRVYRGAHHLAGEIGHITVDIDGPLCACGERGHWEAIASGSALGRMARELVARGGGEAIVGAAGGDPAAITGLHVGPAAAAGDPDARALLDRYADNVAVGIAALVNVFDPELVVVGGGVVELGALLFDPLGRAVAARIEGTEYRPAIGVVPAALGDEASAVGAAVLARQAS